MLWISNGIAKLFGSQLPHDNIAGKQQWLGYFLGFYAQYGLQPNDIGYSVTLTDELTQKGHLVHQCHQALCAMAID